MHPTDTMSVGGVHVCVWGRLGVAGNVRGCLCRTVRTPEYVNIPTGVAHCMVGSHCKSVCQSRAS